ncbi:EIF4E2 family protein [Megaselia abdita]
MENKHLEQHPIKPSQPYENNKPSWINDDEVESSDEEIEVDKLPPIEILPHEHKLQYTYCLWFSRKGTHRATDYSKSLHFVGRCATLEQWWALYCHLIRPSALHPYRELSLFKHGVKPMWEDPANSKGGQWVVRLKKNRIDRAWENLCMAMLGEQFMVGPEICGIVLTTKYPEDSLSVWNRTATDQSCTARVRDTIRRILNLPLNTPMEYKTHCDSLKYVAMAKGPLKS